MAGIVLAAVGVELVIAHPDHDLHLAGAAVTLGGPALYLLGLIGNTARIGYPQQCPRTAAVVLLIAAIVPAA